MAEVNIKVMAQRSYFELEGAREYLPLHMAVALDALVKHYPNVVPYSQFHTYSGLHGDTDGRHTLVVSMSRLRRILKDVGYSVATEKEVGYRLVKNTID